MKVIRNDWIPFRGYTAINLFGWIFVRKGTRISNRVIRHELIHSEQYKDLGYILFPIWYLVEYLVKLVKYMDHDKAYMSISFEREAYLYEHDKNYLKHRKKFNWLRYV